MAQHRAAPLPGVEESLICVMEHSALGRRWVYDGVADVVYAQALARTILTGGVQADLNYDHPVPTEKLKVTTRVRGSGDKDAPAITSVTFESAGTVARIESDRLRLDVPRLVDRSCTSAGRPGPVRNLAGTVDTRRPRACRSSLTIAARRAAMSPPAERAPRTMQGAGRFC
ncbi:hypothetical protein QMK17_00555 [Rhodococcus sp. G-MC3]|uniref:maltokinase N-terminal cap-like domain-containing protein n=1 Tax=Rhodococcus sp. G-MC3 TaxID=3046209 RepID=UPI0024BB6AF5|nr:hypothetical protein [Rhodococcus sp. G-MC3]MDJ0391819.1 hypothetical protein [Rhodococcus sp. G-MC3]